MAKLSTQSMKLRLLPAILWMLLVIVVLFGAIAWLTVKASTISSRLDAAVRLAPQLKNDILQNDADAAEKLVQNLTVLTAEARAAADDPLWVAAGALPIVGANFEATSEIATSADDVARLTATPLIGVFKSLNWTSLAAGGNATSISELANAQPKLASAADAVRHSSSRLNEIDSTKLLPEISKPLNQARQQLTELGSSLRSAADAAALLPPMMGDQAPRRYLLLVQNSAESRASGGIPGALAVLAIDDGKLSLSKQTSAAELGTMNPVVPVEPEQRDLYSTRIGKFMQDVTLTPDFPTSAGIALAMWEQKTGDRLDGVLSVDPVALSYLMNSTGPIDLNEELLPSSANLPEQLSKGNVVRTLLSDVYAAIPEPALQDVYFAGVASEIFDALSSGKGDSAKLIDGLNKGVQEGRILLWSGAAHEQEILARYRLGGAISGPSTAPAQFGAYFNDGTGAKMDYHMKRTVQLIEECPANGYSEVKVRITSTNTAPKDAATSLPEYVTGGGAFGVPAGSVQTNIIAYGPVQSNVETAFVDGKKTGFASHRHSGRPVGSVTLRLAPGQSSTVDFTFGKIVQHTEPQLSVTPTVQALKDVVLGTISAKCAPAA